MDIFAVFMDVCKELRTVLRFIRASVLWLYRATGKNEREFFNAFGMYVCHFFFLRLYIVDLLYYGLYIYGCVFPTITYILFI